jgi:fimbrial isopeptide formation D2 family protein/MYXO-CTERM domain-containing protein
MMAPFRRRSLLGLLAATGALVVSSPARADNPVLRHQEDLHGDVVVFGSTLGYDCGAGVAVPAGATAACAGLGNVTDTAPDLFWRDSVANTTITAVQARTSATLDMPAGATITYARLYWGALKDGAAPDTTAQIDYLNGPVKTITADKTWVVPYGPAHPTWSYYQASGDVTDQVAAWGTGDYRVTDVEALALPSFAIDVDRAFSAWTLVVFYDLPGAELRNLALFDSFAPVDPAVVGQESSHVTLDGFLIPQGFSARMTAFTYEGDAIYDGDHFTLNGAQLTDAQNPAANFFNSSRSNLGVAVSGALDVPKLSGAPGSMAGYDLDTVDVTSQLAPGQTSCEVGADSAKDVFLLGGFVTSVASLAPDFKGMTKQVVDLNGGAVVQGDVLEYTITATNGGNDTSISSVLTDVIDGGLTFVPGSIEVLQGGVLGLKTDAAGDDQGTYDAATKTITVRVGTGADAVTGGKVLVGAVAKLRFKVTVAAIIGSVQNQASLEAKGQAGAVKKTWLSDSDPLTVGDQATVTTIYECNVSSECSEQKPYCNPVTHTCTGCTTDNDCKKQATPACQPDGTCGQCSATNTTLCIDDKPACDTTNGICTLCTLGAMGDATRCKMDPKGPVCVAGTNDTVHCGCTQDGDCGGPKSGVVCDSVPQTCVTGCRGMGGNGCPDGEECSSTDNTIGKCGPRTSGAGGAGGSGTGSTSSASGAGGDGSGGSGVPGTPGDEGRCGCSVPGSDESGPVGAAVGISMIGLIAARRRRRG